MPSSSERLMAYCETGKIINESGADALAVVHGIHDENKLVVTTATHVFEFEVTDVKVNSGK